MGKRFDILPGLFWIGLSIFAMVGAYRLELGDFRDPGAGLIPFITAALLFLVSIPVVLQSLSDRRKNPPGEKGSGKVNWVKVVSVAGSLFAYCLLLPRLGYLVTTTLILLFLFRAASPRSWRFVIGAAVLTAVVTYFGFTYLGLRFPRGIGGI
jgi:hypothetical protein